MDQTGNAAFEPQAGDFGFIFGTVLESRDTAAIFN